MSAQAQDPAKTWNKLNVVGENERLCSRSGENTEQTEIRGKPSHDIWLESSILVLTEPSLFQSRGSSRMPTVYVRVLLQHPLSLRPCVVVASIGESFQSEVTIFMCSKKQISSNPNEVIQ